ncbi:MAG: hypothetical protein AAF495_01470 [Pseudomonadota bacterium]
MAPDQDRPPNFIVQQSDYKVELERICARLEGPVCQVGARAQTLDTKKLNWRQRFAGKGFIGADLEAGENVDAVFDVCDQLPVIQTALAPALAGRQLGAIVCSHLMEHLRRPWVAAGNIESLLPPGGLAFIQVPWVQGFHAFPDDFWRMSLSGLLELFPGLELVDAFYSGGSSDVAYRVWRDGIVDFSLQARQIEAAAFQVLLSKEDNQRFLKSLPEQRAYLSRGYLPVIFVNYLGRKRG